MSTIFSGSLPLKRWGHLGDSWFPPVDLVETPQAFVFRVELAGVPRDAIHIEATQDALTIEGTKEYVRADEQQHYHRMECMYGHFQRRFTVPIEIDPEKVTAEFDQGVLRIYLPKRHQHIAKRIAIQG